jgi:hypothetical protein
MDLVLLLTQTKAAVEAANFIKNGFDTLDKAEQKIKLADLLGALADIKTETAEIKSLIIEKDEKIQLLEKQLKLKNDLIYEPPYYFIDNKDKGKDGPFCQKCWDADEKLIRLQSGNNDIWGCRNCKGSFKGKEHVESSPVTLFTY